MVCLDSYLNVACQPRVYSTPLRKTESPARLVFGRRCFRCKASESLMVWQNLDFLSQFLPSLLLKMALYGFSLLFLLSLTSSFGFPLFPSRRRSSQILHLFISRHFPSCLVFLLHCGFLSSLSLPTSHGLLFQHAKFPGMGEWADLISP